MPGWGKLKRNLQAAHNFGAGGFNVRELEMTMVPLKSVGAPVVREYADGVLARELCASTRTVRHHDKCALADAMRIASIFEN